MTEKYNELLLKVQNKTAIFIAGNTPSSKNSKQIGKVYRKDKSVIPILRNSKVVERYIKESVAEYLQGKVIFKSWKVEYPLDIGMYYIRNSKRRFDGVNASQIVFDLMVKNRWIEDDNTEYVRYHDLGFHKGDNPGVIIAILDFEPKYKI